MFPLIDVRSLPSDFNVGPLTVSRRGKPVRNAYGEMVAATPVSIVLPKVAVHTASARARENLAEALRHSEVIEIYSLVRLYVSDSGLIDTIAYQGRNYVVSFTDDYGNNGGVYISLAVLEDTNL